MKHLSKILLLCWVLLISNLKIIAQNYPVQCTPIVSPPYSLSWTDYATSTEKFKVYLLLKDLEKPSVEVTIRIRLKGLGVVLENITDFVSTKPIVLQPGIPQILSGAQLSDNFSADNLVAQGISIEDLYQGTNLPAGFYQWEVTAYLPDQRQVSNTGVTLMTVFRAQPPTITYPANNAILPNTGFQSINFTWVSNSYYSVNTAQGTLYRLRLYEIPEEDEDADPNVVVNAGVLPVFMTEVLATNYLYSSSDPVLIPGKRYALQVQAMDVNGYDQFENNGFSQVVAFTYGTQGQLATQRCLRPQEVSIEPVGDAGVVVSWTNPNTEVLDYTLSYRKTTDDQWIEKQTSESSYTLLQLPASSYEFKVLARCSYVSKSSFSQPQGYIIAQEPIDSTMQISPPSNTIDEDTDYTSEIYTVSDSNPSQQYPPAVYQAEAPSSTTIDILNKPIRIVYETSSLPDSLKKSLPSGGALPQLSSNATVEELKTALNTSKIDCASYHAGYTCGQHDAPSVPSGDIIQVKTGDEIAINSIAFEVVDLDGSGNGKGIAKIPMFNNAKLGVDFKNIKVAKGGCVVTGQAELSHIDVALLSEEQRRKLAEIYAAYNLALTVADSLAPEISETINNVGEFIQKLKNDVSNYVGGIQDAKKMKANFKFAEKYAETLLKDPILPDSTRQKLSNAYQTALETKDFFCNGTDCNTTSKDGKGPNLIEELITPLCEQNKAKLLALNTVIAEIAEQKLRCNPLQDIVLWGTAEVTHTTLVERGSVESRASERVQIGDCYLTPHYCSDGKLVGYSVSLYSKDNRFNRIIYQVGSDYVQKGFFKSNYSRLMGAAMLYYGSGDPSESVKRMAAGVATNNWTLAWDGLKEEWKNCITDPVCAATLLISTANGVVSITDAGFEITRIRNLRKTDMAKRIEELGNDLDKKKVSVIEGQAGAEIEEMYGYFERYKSTPEKKGDWVSLSGKYKGKTFDEFGGELGETALSEFARKSSQKAKFFTSIDSHFTKADYVVLNLTEMKRLQPSLYQETLNYIATKFGNGKLINISK